MSGVNMFGWKKEFELGIDEIDAQHKVLVKLGGRIVELLSDDSRDDYFDEIFTTLKELESYTITHFTYEEDLFEKTNFIGAGAHKFEHKLFVKKLESYTHNLEKVDSNQKETLLELTSFVSDWLVNHIDKTDRQYLVALSV